MLRKITVGGSALPKRKLQAPERKPALAAEAKSSKNAARSNAKQVDFMIEKKHDEDGRVLMAQSPADVKGNKKKEPWNFELFVALYNEAASEGYGDPFSYSSTPEHLKAYYEGDVSLSLREFAADYFMYEQRT